MDCRATDDKKLLQLLLITSEYLRQLLGEKRNWGFSIDGKMVTAASLRYDIEEMIKQDYPILATEDKDNK